MFQIALTVLDALKQELLTCTDDGEAMTILAEYLENVTNRDASLPVMPDMAAMARGEEADDEEEKEATKVSWRNTTVGLSVRKKIGFFIRSYG